MLRNLPLIPWAGSGSKAICPILERFHQKPIQSNRNRCASRMERVQQRLLQKLGFALEIDFDWFFCAQSNCFDPLREETFSYLALDHPTMIDHVYPEQHNRVNQIFRPLSVCCSFPRSLRATGHGAFSCNLQAKSRLGRTDLTIPDWAALRWVGTSRDIFWAKAGGNMRTTIPMIDHESQWICVDTLLTRSRRSLAVSGWKAMIYDRSKGKLCRSL
jgi:hypothetical protein